MSNQFNSSSVVRTIRTFALSRTRDVQKMPALGLFLHLPALGSSVIRKPPLGGNIRTTQRVTIASDGHTPAHMHRYASAWTSIDAGEALSPVQATKSAPSDAAFSRASLRAFIKPVCECTPDCRDEPWTMPRNWQPLAAAPRSISRICAAAGLSVVAHPTRAKTRSLVILARLATPAGRVTDSQARLTNGPIADKFLTRAPTREGSPCATRS